MQMSKTEHNAAAALARGRDRLIRDLPRRTDRSFMSAMTALVELQGRGYQLIAF